ncbi:MAG: XRE family transcriptional regulator [Allorhizobium sp.]
MTYGISAEWSKKMLALDEHVTPGAGALAARPHVDRDAVSLRAEETRLVFGHFINVARRQRRMTIEKLADDADIEVGELLSIEQDPHYEPDLRTVWGLSNALNLPQPKLMELAGLAVPKEGHWLEEVTRYAARSAPIKDVTPDEQAFHDAVVAALTKKAT